MVLLHFKLYQKLEGSDKYPSCSYNLWTEVSDVVTGNCCSHSVCLGVIAPHAPLGLLTPGLSTTSFFPYTTLSIFPASHSPSSWCYCCLVLLQILRFSGWLIITCLSLQHPSLLLCVNSSWHLAQMLMYTIPATYKIPCTLCLSWSYILMLCAGLFHGHFCTAWTLGSVRYGIPGLYCSWTAGLFLCCHDYCLLAVLQTGLLRPLVEFLDIIHFLFL